MTTSSSPSSLKTFSLYLGALLAAVSLSFTACSKQAGNAKTSDKPVASDKSASPYATVDQKVSYYIGFNVGSGLAREKVVQVDQDAMKAGIADGLSGAKTRIAEADLQAALTTVQEKARAAALAAGEKQQAAAAELIAKNKTRPGVTTTASGLQYEVLTKGIGAKPKPTDTVEVHYHGTLVDGTVFDSSVERGQPVQFQVTGVIPGWIEALQLMSVGDKWKLYIPSSLAYGPRGQGKIPPNSLLIFEVQLISIK